MAEQDTAAPAATPVVFDPPLIYIHRDARVPPLPVYTQAQADALPPEWMAPDEWGGGGGGGGSQGPWTGDVDAAGHNLTNVSITYFSGGEYIASYYGRLRCSPIVTSGITLTGDIDAAGNSLNNIPVINGPDSGGIHPQIKLDPSSLSLSAWYLYIAASIVTVITGSNVRLPDIPQYADLAAAQAALGAGAGNVWRNPSNQLFVA